LAAPPALFLLTAKPSHAGALEGVLYSLHADDWRKLFAADHGNFTPMAVQAKNTSGDLVDAVLFRAPAASDSSETVTQAAHAAAAAIRGERDFEEDVAYLLGGMPYVDPLRALLNLDDKPHVMRLLNHGTWWHRYLGTNVSRPLLDEEIATRVRKLVAGEPHFHTKLAMIYLLLHFGSPVAEVSAWLEQLESRSDEFLECIHRFYSGHPGGTWEGLRRRLTDRRFDRARPVYLLSLALLAERGAHGELDDLEKYATDPLTTRLVERLKRALDAPEQ
jgi:hypothetical protein